MNKKKLSVLTKKFIGINMKCENCDREMPKKGWINPKTGKCIWCDTEREQK